MSPEEHFDIINGVSDEISASFSSLSSSELNWKASPKKWSIGQCIDHIITANTTYFPVLDSLIDGKHQADLWTRVSPLSNLFGNLLIKTMRPENRKPYKTSPVFEPSMSEIGEKIITELEDNNQITIAKFKTLFDLGLSHKVIHSPALNFITYKVHHTLTIIAVHEQRHLLQALDVQSLFPGS